MLNDLEIRELCNPTDWPGVPLLHPFVDHQEGKPSYGLGSFGYDLRLGNTFLVHRTYKAAVLDPRGIEKQLFNRVVREDFFLLQPHSQALAETVEAFVMPRDLTGIVLGKSTYARLGLLVNATPIEAAWRGVLTLELANLSPLPIKIYVGQGIAQVLFFRGAQPLVDYEAKGGFYQDQVGVTLPNLVDSEPV